jgi:hypothetical protein
LYGFFAFQKKCFSEELAKEEVIAFVDDDSPREHAVEAPPVENKNEREKMKKEK